jgi:putative acetyltransferase
MQNISVRRYLPSDADATLDIFLRAIREVAAKDYTKAQIDAWARIDDPKGWAARRGSRPAWIAELQSKPIGFTDLVPDGYLDMLFVHPEYQGMGVASALLAQVENKARDLGLHRIHTEASITALPFFERRGFRVVNSQTVEKRGEMLQNFLMEKFIVG